LKSRLNCGSSKSANTIQTIYYIVGETFLMSRCIETFEMLDKFNSHEKYTRLIPNSAQTWEFYLIIRFMLKEAGGEKNCVQMGETTTKLRPD
jgi:hypothetical protein